MPMKRPPRPLLYGLTGFGLVGLGIVAVPPALRGVTTPPGSLREQAPFALTAKPGALDAITTASLPKPRPLGDHDVLAYASPEPELSRGSALLADPAPIMVDARGVAEAISFYRSGDLAAGDAAAAKANNEIARLTAEWAALRLLPREAGIERIAAFLKNNPSWPNGSYLRRNVEEMLHTEKRSTAEVINWFKQNRPESALGKIAYARALQAQGDMRTATSLLRGLWREAELSASLETKILKDFPDALTKTDHKTRADIFFYKDNMSVAARAATLAGADVAALHKARASYSQVAAKALPPELQNDPTLIFAQVKKLRQDNKFAEAAQLLLDAPRDTARLLVGDEWWTQQRIVARKMLDLGDAATAYRLAARHSAQANDQRIEAEFHAGWIALRFLKDAQRAAPHFDAAAAQAKTPISIARTAYWQGRTWDELGRADDARAAYEKAAAQPTTYYGQLATARLGQNRLTLRMASKRAVGDARALPIRVAELLGALEQKDLAAQIAYESARRLDDEAQIAALAAMAWRMGDARITLNVGKYASQRGFTMDEAAFPTFGVPDFERLPGSATPALVYAIARQESAFDSKITSSAGAKGLMQMLPSTARRTAQRAGVAFDEQRLLSDASFNAKLGAAHLGELIVEHPGPLIFTFAAYNAGGRRVREWIAAYGDPRDPNVDPVDWVERIPFTETRNYVQRVTENLEVYRQRFGEAEHLQIEATLRGQIQR